jgi:Domain of unknown function (DUF1772)
VYGQSRARGAVAAERGTLTRGSPLAPGIESPNPLFLAQLIAAISAGLFAGAGIYINLVEHPARIEAGLAVALAEFGPSYRRAAIMQASLSIAGAATATAAWLTGAGRLALAGGVLLFAVVPFTLLIVFPTNKRLLDPALSPSTPEADELLDRWARLHAVRSGLGLAAFLVLLLSLSP